MALPKTMEIFVVALNSPGDVCRSGWVGIGKSIAHRKPVGPISQLAWGVSPVGQARRGYQKGRSPVKPMSDDSFWGIGVYRQTWGVARPDDRFIALNKKPAHLAQELARRIDPRGVDSLVVRFGTDRSTLMTPS